jgi:5-methylcytosine-specific restriction endonuclease McrA
MGLWKRHKQKPAQRHTRAVIATRHWLRRRAIDAAGGICLGCSKAVNLRPNDPLEATIDHVMPLSKGGQHVLSNVQLLCRQCNCAKGDTLPEFWGTEEAE